jgi:hypothetical protein
VLTEGGKVDTQPAVISSDESKPTHHLFRRIGRPLSRSSKGRYPLHKTIDIGSAGQFPLTPHR